jgi:hypothetical protein
MTTASVHPGYQRAHDAINHLLAEPVTNISLRNLILIDEEDGASAVLTAYMKQTYGVRPHPILPVYFPAITSVDDVWRAILASFDHYPPARTRYDREDLVRQRCVQERIRAIAIHDFQHLASRRASVVSSAFATMKYLSNVCHLSFICAGTPDALNAFKKAPEVMAHRFDVCRLEGTSSTD